MIIKPDRINTQRCETIQIFLGDEKFVDLYEELKDLTGNANDVLNLFDKYGIVVGD